MPVAERDSRADRDGHDRRGQGARARTTDPIAYRGHYRSSLLMSRTAPVEAEVASAA